MMINSVVYLVTRFLVLCPQQAMMLVAGANDRNNEDFKKPSDTFRGTGIVLCDWKNCSVLGCRGFC